LWLLTASDVLKVSATRVSGPVCWLASQKSGRNCTCLKKMQSESAGRIIAATVCGQFDSVRDAAKCCSILPRFCRFDHMISAVFPAPDLNGSPFIVLKLFRIRVLQ